MKLVCDVCGGALQVNAGDRGAECTVCGLRYSIEALREKLGQTDVTRSAEVRAIEKPYLIELERLKNAALGNNVAIILIIGDRPRPLADDSSICWKSEDQQIEIPIYIAKGLKKKFEGVIAGVADGKNLHIVMEVDPKSQTLGVIKESSNSTIHLVERPGATENWSYGQYPKK